MPERPTLPGSSRLGEFFRLREQLATARRAAFSSSEPGFQEYELGLSALRDGSQMASADAGRDTALLLLHSSVRLLVRATALREGGAPSDAPSDLADAINGDETHLAKLPPSARNAALAGMIAFAKRLAAPLEHDATVVQRVIWKRRRRLALASLLLVSALAWSISIATRRGNLALNRPVVVTDREPTFGVDPEHVVDGDRTNLGFHTTSRAHTTMAVDLGTVKPLHRVDVYNRTDCCKERAVPLVLQVSANGSDYRTISRTDRTFELWSVPMPPRTTGRFIRLLHEDSKHFHLSEVEVY